MTLAAVVLEGVSKRFLLRHQKARSFQDALINLVTRRNGSTEEFWALRDVSFQVERGESVAIVGRNGSGKSTVLKMMTRILEPTAGKVTVNGRVSALIELGAGFHPDLTGRENVFLNGSILGLSRKHMQSKLGDIIEFSGLERFIDLPIKHYSSGMHARLGFAVAVSVDPDVLIVDEVLSVGDEAFQRRCIERILEFKARGTSIVFVSHALGTVRGLCDRAVWLDKGIARQIGPAGEVVDSYLCDSNVGDLSPTARCEGSPPATVEHRKRWGNLELEIVGVETLDGGGKPVEWCLSGQPLTVRMRYLAKRRLPDSVFGIAIHTSTGVHVAGPNNTSTGCHFDVEPGTGWVDFTIGSLPLLEGNYELTVAVYDRTITQAYDHHDRMYPLNVRRMTVGGQNGLIALDGRWRHVNGGMSVSEKQSGAAQVDSTTRGG